MNRSRTLLDLAHDVPECANCRKWTGGCEPGHENSVEAGKGFGNKAQDNRHAALCHECHAWYDQGGGKSPCGLYEATKADKADMWNRAHKRTFDYYWRQKWLKVAS